MLAVLGVLTFVYDPRFAFGRWKVLVPVRGAPAIKINSDRRFLLRARNRIVCCVQFSRSMLGFVLLPDPITKTTLPFLAIPLDLFLF